MSTRCTDSKDILIFQTLYKTQVRELKEEIDEKIKQFQDVDMDYKALEADRSVHYIMSHGWQPILL